METNEWFRIWFGSPYYDLLYRERNQEEANKLVGNLVQTLQINPGSYVLDAACGKGRHCIALADKGLDVTGFDLSPVAINEAKKYENEHLHFFLHDIRRPFFINYFTHAFNFFTSYGYFKTMREHNDATRTIAQSLKQNGVFILDYLNIGYVEENLIQQEKKEIAQVVFEIKRWQDKNFIFKQIRVFDKNKNVEETFTERVQKFSLKDFTGIFLNYGLRIENVYGNYALQPYEEKLSGRMIISARKIN